MRTPSRRRWDVESKEIFELIVKADEALKYATEEKQAARAAQATRLLTQARDEALAIGNDALVQQAQQRLSDLQRIEGEAGAPPGEG